MAISLPIGASNSGTNDWSDVHGEDQAIVDYVNGNIVGSDLVNSTVPDAKLASPNNSVYRSIFTASNSRVTQAGTATEYFNASGRTDVSLNIGTTVSPVGLYFAAADFTVGSLTQKLRLRAQLNTNAAVDAITHTFGLYPVSGSSAGAYTLGAVVSGSTVAFASPSANSLNQGNSGDFTIPADGFYIFGIARSATTAQSTGVHVQLQTRNV